MRCFVPITFSEVHCNLLFESVHDGWGIAPKNGIEGNAIEAADTTNMDTIAKKHAYRTLLAHGNAVGLSDGLMGNSEVGYVDLYSHSNLSLCSLTLLRSDLNQTSQHRCWPDRLAGHCPNRCFHRKETVPSEQDDSGKHKTR